MRNVIGFVRCELYFQASVVKAVTFHQRIRPNDKFAGIKCPNEIIVFGISKQGCAAIGILRAFLRDILVFMCTLDFQKCRESLPFKFWRGTVTRSRDFDLNSDAKNFC